MSTDPIYRHLNEAEAYRANGAVTARHPAAYPLEGLLQLKAAADRYGHLIRTRERLSLGAWADRIEADAIASIDADRDAIVAALRSMQRAALHEDAPPTWRDRLRSFGTAVARNANAQR